MLTLYSLFQDALTAPTSVENVGQEMLHATLLLSCAFVGWCASNALINCLGWSHKNLGGKAKEGSDAFREEITAYVQANSIDAATKHFGLSQTEILNCIDAVEQKQQTKIGQIWKLFKEVGNNDFEKKSPQEEFEPESEDICDLDFSTSPSLNPGLVLLEQYGVFGATSGTWSGAVDQDIEECEEPDEECEDVYNLDFSIATSMSPGLLLLEQYGVLGASTGTWSGPLVDTVESPKIPKDLLSGIDFTIEEGEEPEEEPEDAVAPNKDEVGDISTKEPSEEEIDLDHDHEKGSMQYSYDAQERIWVPLEYNW